MLTLQCQFIAVFLFTLVFFKILGMVSAIDTVAVALTTAPFISASVAARTFAREHGRVLKQHEYRQLLWVSAGSLYCVQVLSGALSRLTHPDGTWWPLVLVCFGITCLQIPILVLTYSDLLVKLHINNQG